MTWTPLFHMYTNTNTTHTLMRTCTHVTPHTIHTLHYAQSHTTHTSHQHAHNTHTHAHVCLHDTCVVQCTAANVGHTCLSSVPLRMWGSCLWYYLLIQPLADTSSSWSPFSWHPRPTLSCVCSLQGSQELVQGLP
jgi:hypothetical protein